MFVTHVGWTIAQFFNCIFLLSWVFVLMTQLTLLILNLITSNLLVKFLLNITKRTHTSVLFDLLLFIKHLLLGWVLVLVLFIFFDFSPWWSLCYTADLFEVTPTCQICLFSGRSNLYLLFRKYSHKPFPPIIIELILSTSLWDVKHTLFYLILLYVNFVHIIL